MTIWVNQNEHQYDASLSLLAVLKDLGKADKTGIAVAVNNSVIPKNNWTELIINHQDKITIITATQGG